MSEAGLRLTPGGFKTSQPELLQARAGAQEGVGLHLSTKPSVFVGSEYETSLYSQDSTKVNFGRFKV